MRAEEAWMSVGYDARYRNTDEVLECVYQCVTSTLSLDKTD